MTYISSGVAVWLLLMICVCGAADVYVAENGEDRPSCGHHQDTPCRTLFNAVSIAAPGDIIHLDAQTGEGEFFTCGEVPVFINNSLTLYGSRGRVRIGCGVGNPNGTLYNLTSTQGSPINVTFTNVNMTNTHVFVSDVNLHIEDSYLKDVDIMTSYNGCQHIGISIINTRSDGAPPSPTRNSSEAEDISPLIGIRTGYLNLYYYNSSFYHQKHTLMAYVKTHFLISNIFFGNLPNVLSIHGGIYLSVHRTEHSTVVVQDSVFRDQVSFDPITSIRNLFEAAFYVRGVSEPHEMKSNASNVSVEILRNEFIGNERGLTFIGFLNIPVIRDCTFINNIAMHAGAGVLYILHPMTHAAISNSTFIGNAAGKYRAENVKNYTETFQVNADEVLIHSKCCKGVISFVGKGGGIRVQRGLLHAENCVFKSNTARLLGGAVFVDRESEMTLEHTYMHNAEDHTHALQGDLIYSDGKVTIRDVTFLVLTASSHVAVLRHSGDHWSIMITDVAVQCPVGYRLRITNTSAYGVQDFGLQRSYKMDQLSYFCESCARNKYSLDYGYLNYSLVYTSLTYYTLLINGKEPQPAYEGSYAYHNIECLECPYGGRCQNSITAVPNFWGYVRDGSMVEFQHCPRDYCCSSTNCPTYNTCAEHRTGDLCGKCEDDYSEALFSSQCVLNSECSATWLWPFAIISGLMYFLFLLFQKDIRDLIFASTMSWKQMPCCKKKPSAYRPASNNHVLADDAVTHSLHDGECDALDRGISMEVQVNGVKKNNNTKATEDEEHAGDNQPAPDTGASFLIILFYYFQDAQLLHIHTVFALAEGRSKSMIKTILSGLFKFRLEIFQFVDKVCFLSHIRPHMKQFIQVFMVPYVLFQFGVVYFFYQCNRKIQTKNVHTSMPRSTNGNKNEEPSKTATRLATGFVLSLLFTYQKLATTSFTLLNCVPIKDKSVLYIEGTITCYEVWQYGVMAYVSFCIVPFCLTLLLGPGLLRDGLIGLPQFFCACIVPAPFLVYWVIIRLKLRGQRPDSDSVALSGEAKAVINILQGPFKETESFLFGPTCGQGVLIGRRLILVILYTFVNDPLIRMLCMMLVCFIILLHHVHVLPFKDTKGNLAGSTSAAALLVMGVINLVRAGFEAAEYTPQGPNEVLMYVFEEVEDVLMLWFPLGVMIIVFVSLGAKFTLTFMACALNRERDTRHEHVDTDCTTL